MNRTAVLTGLGSALPPLVVTNNELAEHLNTTDEWIFSRTGIRQRHVATTGIATSDLAVEAGAQALKSAQCNDADLVVLATTTPDHPCPATAPDVAARLGLGGVPAFDIAAVCSGFVYALAVGAGVISGGLAERVLVIGAETFTTIIDPSDRTTAAIFADGAGAVVLRAGERDEPGALLEFDLGSDGEGRSLIVVPGGGARERTSGEPAAERDRFFTMQGQSVFRNAINHMTTSSRTVLARTGWDINSIDWFVGHQANVRILHAVVDALGIPRSKAVINIDQVGNTSAASIPLALSSAVAENKLAPGDRLVITAFGGGLTWGAVSLTWPDLFIASSTSS